MDDGSTDDSLQICKEYAKQYSHINVLTQCNAGPAAARNAAIDKAKGDYLLFVDADDTVSPNYFDVLSSAICKHPAPLYYFGCRHDDGKRVEDKTSPFIFLDSHEMILDFLEYSNYLLYKIQYKYCYLCTFLKLF